MYLHRKPKTDKNQLQKLQENKTKSKFVISFCFQSIIIHSLVIESIFCFLTILTILIRIKCGPRFAGATKKCFVHSHTHPKQRQHHHHLTQSTPSLFLSLSLSCKAHPTLPPPHCTQTHLHNRSEYSAPFEPFTAHTPPHQSPVPHVGLATETDEKHTKKQLGTIKQLNYWH